MSKHNTKSMNDITAKEYRITKKDIYSCQIYLFWENNEATVFNLCKKE